MIGFLREGGEGVLKFCNDTMRFVQKIVIFADVLLWLCIGIVNASDICAEILINTLIIGMLM